MGHQQPSDRYGDYSQTEAAVKDASHVACLDSLTGILLVNYAPSSICILPLRHLDSACALDFQQQAKRPGQQGCSLRRLTMRSGFEEREGKDSLCRLQTDRLDLYLRFWSRIVPLAETVEGTQALIGADRIRRWGVSHLDLGDADELFRGGGERCATDQILYNAAQRGADFDMLPPRRLPHQSIGSGPHHPGRYLAFSLFANSMASTTASANSASRMEAFR